MPDITIPSFVITGIQLILAFVGAFVVALWLSMVVWTFRDARRRSRDIFAILLATLMVVIFGPLGLLLYTLLRPPVTLDELYERSLEEEALLQDLEERPRCPGCSRQVKEDWIICPDCHTTLQNVCQECGQTLQLSWSLCPYCATPVETSPDDQGQPGLPSQGQVVTRQMEPAVAEPAPYSATPAADPTVPQQPVSSPTSETQPHIPEAGTA
jgi:RNA polymerase subunit RPABC4/transcription elongation factor Spt4